MRLPQSKVLATVLALLITAFSRLPAHADSKKPSRVTLEPDSVTLRKAITDTWENFKETRRFEIKDTLIKYPKFIKLCLAVYNWVDLNLNTYDPQYVTGTGKNGKVRLVSDHWTDLHAFTFKELTPLMMVSSPYSNLGIQANYSILSVGFSVDMNALISGKKSHHKKTQLGVTTARVMLDAYYWHNTGTTEIRHYGDDDTGKIDYVDFNGQKSKSFGVGGFYIFNYKKYSHAAAYNLSNYQIKSAGSWIAGATGTFYDSSFDFTQLPDDIKQVTNFPFDVYRFDYNAINLMGGYGYNWVINRHWLFNTTTLPGIGLGLSFRRSTGGRSADFSIAGRQLNSLTYTTRQFFVSVVSDFRCNFLLTKNVSFMSGIANLQVSTGVRF